ncbi:restriction endonuclease [Deinococcus oregonensis]|uniref:Restriction endonuclease n=1 Tax=Deinococcus oregonensis TaxID=1805970 RepID=A0ABV6AYC5_9DEIO
MPIPDYQTFMRPLLSLLQSGKATPMKEIYSSLAKEFNLTEQEMAEMLPSGRQATYMNRIGWAKTYLVKSGAVESPQRSWVQITSRGQTLLKKHPKIVTNKVLLEFPEFAAFQRTNTITQTEAAQSPKDSLSILSPEEELGQLYAAFNASLTSELLLQINQITPQQFERLVVEVLVAMGYGGSVRDAGQALGRSGDNGIDGVVKQDPLGLDKVYIQAKQWTGNVGSQEVRNFSGSLTYHKTTKGVLITTAGFSPSAKDTARQIGNIILIDGDMLAQLMIEHNVGVVTRETYKIRRVDSEYFEEL